MQKENISQASSHVYQIYDSIFKTALTLSPQAIIHFINGLYHTNYPMNSTIEYHWTESHDRRLKRTLADTILTINHSDVYHLEGQMTKDKKMVFRVFQYDFQYSSKAIQTDEDGLIFPESVIIYLDKENDIPQYQTMPIILGNNQEIVYKVRTFCYQDYSIHELMERKMIILLPFQLLKYKDVIKEDSSKNEITGLKKLIANDIVENIYQSLYAGDIVYNDVVILLEMIKLLGQWLYGENQMCIEEGVVAMLTEPIVLESVIMIDEYEERLADMGTQLSNKDLEIARLHEELEKLKEQLNT